MTTPIKTTMTPTERSVECDFDGGGSTGVSDSAAGATSVTAAPPQDREGVQRHPAKGECVARNDVTHLHPFTLAQGQRLIEGVGGREVASDLESITPPQQPEEQHREANEAQEHREEHRSVHVELTRGRQDRRALVQRLPPHDGEV